jgi:hypothetical protein
MAMERYQGQSVVGPVGRFDVSGGQRAAAAGYGTVARVADQVRDFAAEELAHDSEVQGQLAGAKDAVQYDENGKLLPLTTLPDDFTIYGKAYREAAIVNYRTAAEGDAALKADDMGRQFEQDPEGFRQNWNTYVGETAQGLHPEVAAELTPYLHRIGTMKFGALADAKAKREVQAAVDGAWASVEAKAREALHLSDTFRLSGGAVLRTGEIVTQEIAPLLARVQAIDPNFSGAEADDYLRKLQGDLISRAIMHEAWDTADGSKIVVNGVARPNTDAAMKFLNGVVDNPPPELAAMMSPDELEKLRGDAMNFVNLKSAESEQHRQQAAESIQVATNKNANAWAERIDQADSFEDLSQLYLESRSARFSGDPSTNEAVRGQVQNSIRSRQASLTAKIEKDRPLYDMLARSETNGTPLPMTSKGKEAADLAADSLASGAGLTVGQAFDPYSEEGRANIVGFANRYGHMPSFVVDELSNATAQRDPERLQQLAFTYADAVAANPQLKLPNNGVGEKAHRFLTEIADGIRLNGFEPGQAASQALAHVTEGSKYDQMSRQRQAAAAAVKDDGFVSAAAKEALAANVAASGFYATLWRDTFNEPAPPGLAFIPESMRAGWTSIIPGVGNPDPVTVRQLDPTNNTLFQGMFKPLFERYLAETDGDRERAAQLALGDLSTRSGYTMFSKSVGKLSFDRYPVEGLTGLSPGQVEGSLIEALGELDKEPQVRSQFTGPLVDRYKAGKVYLQPNESAIASPLKMGWNVWAYDETGRLFQVNRDDRPFIPTARTKAAEDRERRAAETVKGLPGPLRGVAASTVELGLKLTE